MIFAGRPPANVARGHDGRWSRSGWERAASSTHRDERRRESARCGGPALVNVRRSCLPMSRPATSHRDTASQVMGLILEHVEQHGATLVLVTHDEELAHTSPIAYSGSKMDGWFPDNGDRGRDTSVRLIDLLSLPVIALWQEKLRTLLTTLGVVFGAFVLAASLSISEGFKRRSRPPDRTVKDISRRVQVFSNWNPVSPGHLTPAQSRSKETMTEMRGVRGYASRSRNLAKGEGPRRRQVRTATITLSA